MNSIFTREEKFAFGLRLRRMVDKCNENAKEHNRTKVTLSVLASEGQIKDNSTAGDWLRGTSMPPKKEQRENLSKFFGKDKDYFEDNRNKLYSEMCSDERLLQMYIDEELLPTIMEYGLDLKTARKVYLGIYAGPVDTKISE